MTDPRNPFRTRAKELVDANAERHPGLLVEQIASANYESSVATSRAVFTTKMAIVALRMLKRAGKLKPTTDDERAAAELAGYLIDLPAASRRLLHPMTPEYVGEAVASGQMILNTYSQESVNEDAA